MGGPALAERLVGRPTRPAGALHLRLRGGGHSATRHSAGGRRAAGEAVHRRRAHDPGARSALPALRTEMLRSPIAATPPGALDLTGEAARRRRALQREAVAVLERAGYEELLPPTFEYEDVFLRAGGAGVAERLVRFPDRDGRILALRYDFTASIARVASTTFADARRTAPALLLGTGLPAGARARRSSAGDSPGRRRAAGSGRPDRRRRDRPADPRRSCAPSGSTTFS